MDVIENINFKSSIVDKIIKRINNRMKNMDKSHEETERNT